MATTQEVVNRIRRDLDQALNPRPDLAPPLVTLASLSDLFEAANDVGQVSLAVQNQHGPALRQVGASVEASFILGGQIAGQPHGLHLIYPQGNSIAATPETPDLQIGESKYGKNILDQVVTPALPVNDRCRLVDGSPPGRPISSILNACPAAGSAFLAMPSTIGPMGIAAPWAFRFSTAAEGPRAPRRRKDDRARPRRRPLGGDRLFAPPWARSGPGRRWHA